YIYYIIQCRSLTPLIILQSLLYLGESPAPVAPVSLAPLPPLQDCSPLYDKRHSSPVTTDPRVSSTYNSLENSLPSSCLRSIAPLSAQSATPVLQHQGSPSPSCLLPVTFQEGRRASDTYLTQGARALRQLRRSVRMRGLLCLGKLRHGGLSSRGGRSVDSADGGDPQGFLLDVLQQQRLLQISLRAPSTSPSGPALPHHYCYLTDPPSVQ
ncbi:putative serine/threonine-protein kinase SIK1B, partial [Hyla sarda]|uniref:putative serine/threonine-protein kinase SIK1B n=1 Tax=Hyla sarda TaxID=327740 RepID=UPI0024C3B754